jgi:V/A-type H+-transporting ATPase subunit D
MAEIENTIMRLADNIMKTQKRANALKSIIIPKYEQLVSYIQNSLEEKDREEISRLHVLKMREQ